MTSRVRRLAVALFTTVVVAVGAWSAPALAANAYTVTGSTPRPEACDNHGTVTPGAWLTNGPCGYILGTALAGQTFEVNQTSDAGFHYGRVRGTGGANFCAWILPGSLDLSSGHAVADSCSDATKTHVMNSRLSFGRDFDADPHTGNGEIRVAVNPSACTGYYNYFTDSDFSGGQLRDPVGFALPSYAGYRFTSRDGQASMIRADVDGETYWFFVARSCIDAQLPAGLSNKDNPEAG